MKPSVHRDLVLDAVMMAKKAENFCDNAFRSGLAIWQR